ncbi:MAG: hypothetical protein K6G28_00740 [Acholeplasmatales bacterium]|nr:hypothetical protein [Acholeplasmatales bacterium]
MKICKNAASILNACLKENCKYAIVLTYQKDSKEISMSLVDDTTKEEITNVDGVNIIFKNGAKEATKNWEIVEKDSKLSIQRKDKCCCDDHCEYACNKVTCDCE